MTLKYTVENGYGIFAPEETSDASTYDTHADRDETPLFEWAKGKVLTREDFEIADKVHYVRDFVYSESITLIYSPPKQGKTWLGYGIATAVAARDSVVGVYYLDMDNSISTLKERKIHETLLKERKIHYITRGTIGCEPIEQLAQIAAGAVRHIYEGVVFFLDTTKDFVDTDNKNQSVRFMQYCVRIRDAGGTVIVMHHATKNKKTISGNPVFTNTPDNVYEMKQIGKMANIINYDLKVTHARGLVKDCRWSVDTKSLHLREYDAIASGLSDADKEAAEAAYFALKNAPNGLSMSKLIEAMGMPRTDRRGKRIVKELTGSYWRREEVNRNKHIYRLIEEQK